MNPEEDADSEENRVCSGVDRRYEDKYGRVLFLSFSGYDEDIVTDTTSEDDGDHPFLKTISDSTLAAVKKRRNRNITTAYMWGGTTAPITLSAITSLTRMSMI